MRTAIISKKGRGEQIHARVTSNPDSPDRRLNEYVKDINIRDPHDWAFFLDDMRTLFSAPIEKAVELMRKNSSPFW